MGSQASVVFIHGFLSGEDTWKAFDEVIAGDVEFAGDVEVEKFAYDTRAFQLHPLRRIPGLSDVAESLRVKLVNEIPAGRPVVLVTHSMGGLVVQQYLADRVRGGTTEELESIAGIVMFSCPNEGSLLLFSTRRWVSLVPRLRNRQERALRPINRDITANRKEVLNRIVHAEDPAMRIPMWLYAGESDGVVLPQSARSVFPDRFVGALPGDHFSIIRPDSARHRSYLTLKNRINHAVTDHQRRRQDGNQQRPPPHAGVTDTLRPDLDRLVGRDDEIQQILAAADITRVIAVDGMAGAGKTALVTRVAHLLADQFPDGRYFVDLNAHTPGQASAEPTDMLARLLTNLGVEPSAIPESIGARQDLWLDRVRDRRVLLVLDDALDPAQVEPLLPSGPGCLTVITSRRRLSALEAAVMVSVDTLAPDAAVNLFCTAAGRAPTDDDLNAVGQIVRLCGYLPLAIALLAGRLAQHPTWTIPALATDFAAAKNRLTHIDLDARHRALRASFTLSYEDLPVRRQQLFRRLGLHLGPGLETNAVAALAGIAAETARYELDALYTDHMLDEIGPGRYRLHDLLREYANTLAEDDPIEDQIGATDRLLDHYQTIGNDPDQATLRWVRIERENLLACLNYTVSHSQPTRVVALTRILAELLHDDGPWTLAIALHHSAATAAHQIGDRRGEADSLHQLGRIRYSLDEYPLAQELFQQALDIHRDIGNRRGEADSLHQLGRIRYSLDEYPLAQELFQQALDIHRDIRNRRGEADSLHQLGGIRYSLDEYPLAQELFQQALDIHRDIRNRRGEAAALHSLGMIHSRLDKNPLAQDLFQQALDIYRDIGNRRGEADSLHSLGVIHSRLNEHPVADQQYRQALNIYRDIGNRRGEADSLHSLGMIRSALDEYPLALELVQQALDIYRDIGDRRGEADSLHQLGGIRSALDEYPLALELIQQALDIYRDIGDRRGQADSLRALGLIRSALGEYPLALELVQQALDIHRDIGNRRGEADSLHMLGVIRYALDEYPLAEELYQQALDIYRDIGNRSGEAASLNSLGVIRYVLKEYLLAQELFQQALDIYRDIGNRSGEAEALQLLGVGRQVNGEYPAAKKLLENALDIYRKIGRRHGEAEALRALSSVRHISGSYRAAIELLQRALAIYRELDNRNGEALTIRDRAAIHFALGEYAIAKGLYLQALGIYRDIGRRTAEAGILYELGQVRRASGDHTAAVKLYQQALNLYRALGNRQGEAKVLAKLVDTPNALQALIGSPQLLASQLDSWLTQFRQQ
ncbi:alpha/beta fold hydrolase [Nocardia sp. R7R-8]|uniref:alpha/beta fold hydrolase n=1 Tax=Nocardia sp. R7R-8 TaxID=3459304 RepID=UPI00403D73C0